MDRRQFIRSVIVGTLAAPFVTRQVPPIKARILRSLKRRSQLGQVSGTIALSYQDYAALDDRGGRLPQDLLRIEGVPCVRLSELAPNEYWIYTTGLLG